ncbi:Pre-mRNA polyadenylation factor fip1 [Vanrija pseudolonga]|uniref:Pre-mRNA polyadenylation factor fip1 n=1 Tax=Vanrija pseudolonga TaxID=143232 RepID=A0AAF0Y317_9TREE|nr:Pre-mRNA polyadenylation factor fip1 [Vanrija pseudolonga]
MHMDDDDAFLYGDQSPPAKPAAELPKAAAANGISDSMAASLAAYGIDPSVAVAEEKVVDEVPEDGGVEEEGDDDDDDDESDSDDDDIKLVFTSGPQRTLDLRKPQQPQSNVIGIGKWAHTSTGAAPAAVSPIKPAPARSAAAAATAAAPDALTDYTPAARPGQAASAAAPAGSYDATPSQAIVAGNGPPPTTQLPHSTLAVQTVPSSTAPIDPTNPTGIIPSTGTSVYDVDTAQFEGSGQMWRRPGSDISDWFNYGFDEVTYPKFLKFRQEMEQGARALASLGPMGQITPDMAQMLHVQMAPNPQQLQQMQQMQMMAMQGMDPAAMFAMQNAQNMQGGGMGMGMMGNAMQQQQQQQQMQQGLQRQAHTSQSQGEIQQQAQVPPVMAGRGGHIAARGRGGAALRGRGGVPVGPRAAVLAGNIPKGPKAGRFKDKDRVAESAAAGTSLDYGDDPYGGGSGPGSHHERSRSASPARSDYRERDRRDRYEEREHRDDRHEERDRYGERDRDRSERSSSRRDYDDRHEEGSEGEYDERGGGDRHGDRERDRERDDRYGSERDDRYGERDDRTPASSSGKAGLGPDGWESGEEEEQQQQRRSTRRRR